MRRLLTLAALLTTSGAAAIPPVPALPPSPGLYAQARPAPSLCRVTAKARPTILPGFYTVTVRLRPDCPLHAVANVRLESHIGGTYPRYGFRRITHAAPLIHSGVPWWWRVGWRAQSGIVYPLAIPEMRPPDE